MTMEYSKNERIPMNEKFKCKVTYSYRCKKYLVHQLIYRKGLAHSSKV